MHLLKTAMVNGDFLAFITMEHGVYQTENIVESDLTVSSKRIFQPIWKFMRHALPAIGLEQIAICKRHGQMRQDIISAMTHGTQYPWAMLARLQAKKFYSDVFEAVLGAIWIDSGSLAACEALLSRFGILSYLNRILRDGVHVLHPKEDLGRRAGTRQVMYGIEIRKALMVTRSTFVRFELGIVRSRGLRAG